MLRAIGSTEIPEKDESSCYDVCGQIPSYLCFELLSTGSTSEKQKRRVAVREVDDELQKQRKKRLLTEREKYLDMHPSLGFIGADFVFPEAAVTNICSRARFITCVEDLSHVYSIRQDFQQSLFEAVMDVLSVAPKPKRRRKG